METLQEAKKYLKENYEEGASCPCCGQFVKMYKRKLNSQMARFLGALWAKQNAEWHSPRSIVGGTEKASSDGTYLVHWNLIERNETTGFYRITPKGHAFVQGTIRVPSHVYLYNNKRIKYSDTYTTFREALGNKFKFSELMKT